MRGLRGREGQLSAGPGAVRLHHGAAGAAAISEGNGVGALVGVAAPLVLGAAVAAGLGWRPAIAVAAVLAVASVLAVRRLPDEPALRRGPIPGPRGEQPPLGATFWLVLGVLAVGVGVEFSTTFWAGDLLQVRLGAAWRRGGRRHRLHRRARAGRLLAGRLALGLAVPRLLLGALATALAGWAVP